MAKAGHSKRRATEKEKADQKQRTSHNYRIKYERLVKKYPDSKDLPIWKEKLDSLIQGKFIK